MTGKFIKKKFHNFIDWFKNRLYFIRRWYCRKLIKSRDFTIISNNCWAGKVYQYLDMPYLSPTVGLYFFADDYLKFVRKLRYYLSLDLQFIPVQESKHCSELIERKQEKIPIGVLDDVEIIFRHYKTEQEAREKWERRKSRINWNNIFIKFSRMDGCTEDHLMRFDNLPFHNKIMLNIISRTVKYKSEVIWKGPQNKREILMDTTPFPGNISLFLLLNRKPETYSI